MMIWRARRLVATGVSVLTLSVAVLLGALPTAHAQPGDTDYDLELSLQPIGTLISTEPMRWRMSVTNNGAESLSDFYLNVVLHGYWNPVDDRIENQSAALHDCSIYEDQGAVMVAGCAGSVLESGATVSFDMVWKEALMQETMQQASATVSYANSPEILATLETPEYPVFLPGNGPVVDRAGGQDRYETSALISAQAFADPEDVQRVFLVSGQAFPDALAAASLSSGSVLLSQRERIPDTVVSELKRLQPENIDVVGGLGVLSDAIMRQAKQIIPTASVRRIGGNDRFETAAKLVTDGELRSAYGGFYIANGMNFPDALAAAAGYEGPVLLTQKDQLSPATLAALKQATFDEMNRVVIVGGEGVVSAQVEKQLQQVVSPATVERVGGSDRFETASLVANSEVRWAYRTVVANAFDYPDALVGAVLAREYRSPVVLTSADQLSPATKTALQVLKPGWVTVAGGEGVVNEKVRQEIAAVTGLKLK